MLLSKTSVRVLLPGLLVLFAVGAVAGADALPEAAAPGLERAVEVSGHEVLPVRAGQDTDTEVPGDDVVEPDPDEVVEPDPDEELVEPDQLDPTACDEFETHGACVSDAARNICEPGPGHGACVREYAHLNHGQTKDDEPVEEADAEGSSTAGKAAKADRAEKAAKPAKAPKAAKSGKH